MIALWLASCSFLQGPPIPQPVVDQVGSELSGLGHPRAEFESATIVGWQRGSMTTTTHDRFVDIDVRYKRKKEDHADSMVLRLYLESPVPCKVTIDVLSDTGPNPVLLDNAVASNVVGQAICDAMGPG